MVTRQQLYSCARASPSDTIIGRILINPLAVKVYMMHKAVNAIVSVMNDNASIYQSPVIQKLNGLIITYCGNIRWIFL
jgi:hypothetical protein